MNSSLPFTSYSHQVPSGSKLRSITHVTVLEDLPGTTDDADLDAICRPLLIAKQGQTIEVVDQYSSSVWVGIVNDRQGAFKLDMSVQPVLHIGERMRALYPWAPPPGEDGLTFSKGDIIEVLRRSEDNWWFWGKLNDRTGVVPINFVESVEDPKPQAGSVSDTNDASSAPTPAKLKVKAIYDCRVPLPGDLMFRTGDVIEVAQKYADGWWDGIFGVQRGKFPITFVTFSINPLTAPSIKKCPLPPWCPYYVRTIYGYCSGFEDELSFSAGEIIEVYDMSSAPWLEGRRRDGKTGLFPVNYTIRVLDRRTPISKVYVAPVQP